MAEKKDIAAPSFFSELFQVDLYKPSMGKIVRQVVFFTLLVIFIVAGWRMQTAFGLAGTRNGLTLFLGVSAVGAWISYRLVNYPRLADFLISVEGEMAKISWPTKTELIRSAIVVIVVMIILSVLLWVFDAVWFKLFTWLGIIPEGEAKAAAAVLDVIPPLGG
jgi:preprotein translocase subunit SecE